MNNRDNREESFRSPGAVEPARCFRPGGWLLTAYRIGVKDRSDGLHQRGPARTDRPAVVQLRRHRHPDHPRNKVRFTWFSAEESGLLGSEAYVASLDDEERDQIAAMLNFDMVGSPNFVRFIYDGDRVPRKVRPRSRTCSSTTSATRASRPHQPNSADDPTTARSSRPAFPPVDYSRTRPRR
jgi:hypothetical protein